MIESQVDIKKIEEIKTDIKKLIKKLESTKSVVN